MAYVLHLCALYHEDLREDGSCLLLRCRHFNVVQNPRSCCGMETIIASI